MGRILQPVLSIPLNRGQFDHKSPLEGFFVELFGDLTTRGFLNSGCRRPWTVYTPEVRYVANTRPWIHVLNMSGFKPGDISVKVDDSMIYIHAKHEVTDGDNVDITERIRYVKIPKGVNVKKIACFINRSGKFVIKAPFSLKKKCDEMCCDFVSKSGIEKCNKGEVNEESQSHAKENIDNLSSVDQSDRSTSGKNEPTDQKPEDGDLIHEKEESKNPVVVDTENLASIGQLHIEDDNCIKAKQEDGSPTTSFVDPETENPSNSRCSSRSDSPLSSGDFVILDENEDVENDREQKHKTDTDVNDNNDSLEPLADSTEVTEGEDQKKYFLVKINLDKFSIDNISVKCKDGALLIDATRQWEDSDVKRNQEVHRQYQLPKLASEYDARAFISDGGQLHVKIPISEEHVKDISVEEM